MLIHEYLIVKVKEVSSNTTNTDKYHSTKRWMQVNRNCWIFKSSFQFLLDWIHSIFIDFFILGEYSFVKRTAKS